MSKKKTCKIERMVLLEGLSCEDSYLRVFKIADSMGPYSGNSERNLRGMSQVANDTNQSNNTSIQSLTAHHHSNIQRICCPAPSNQGPCQLCTDKNYLCYHCYKTSINGFRLSDISYTSEFNHSKSHCISSVVPNHSDCDVTKQTICSAPHQKHCDAWQRYILRRSKMAIRRRTLVCRTGLVINSVNGLARVNCTNFLLCVPRLIKYHALPEFSLKRYSVKMLVICRAYFVALFC